MKYDGRISVNESAAIIFSNWLPVMNTFNLRHQATLFYADDGMVVSSEPAWLQGAFNAMVGLFDRVGLQTNVGKTVSMVFHPYQEAVNITQVAYGRRLMGEGNSYK